MQVREKGVMRYWWDVCAKMQLMGILLLFFQFPIFCLLTVFYFAIRLLGKVNIQNKIQINTSFIGSVSRLIVTDKMRRLIINNSFVKFRGIISINN